MCGRFSVSLPPDEVARYFRISGPLPNFPPRYNMAPTQLAPIVRFNPETNTRQLDLMRCGLVPGRTLAFVGLLFALAGCTDQFSGPYSPSDDQLCKLPGYGAGDPGCPSYPRGQ